MLYIWHVHESRYNLNIILYFKNATHTSGLAGKAALNTAFPPTGRTAVQDTWHSSRGPCTCTAGSRADPARSRAGTACGTCEPHTAPSSCSSLDPLRAPWCLGPGEYAIFRKPPWRRAIYLSEIAGSISDWLRSWQVTTLLAKMYQAI